jgi:hypothetical protein
MAAPGEWFNLGSDVQANADNAAAHRSRRIFRRETSDELRERLGLVRSAHVAGVSARGGLGGNDKIERTENTRVGTADCGDRIQHPGGGSS